MPGLPIGLLARVALAKQTAEGAPAVTAEFSYPVYTGGVTPDESRQEHEATDTLAYRRGEYKTRVGVGGSIEVPSFPDAGPRLTHALLGVDAVTGAADPWSHALTRGDNRPWLTAWEGRVKQDQTLQWDRFDDCRVKAVEWRFSAGQIIRQMVELVGKAPRGNVAAPTITTAKVLDNVGPWHTMIGATLLLDLDATPAVTQVRNVVSGSIRLEYPDLELVQTDELTPRFEDRGLFRVGFNAECVVEDYAAYLATIYGSKTAADQPASRAIVVGALDFLFNVGAAADNNRTLRHQLPSVPFSASPPAIDPSGKGLRFSLVGKMTHPAAGEPVTVTYKNAVSTAS